MNDMHTKTSFEEFIQSELFTFHVGEQKKPFVVHSGAVAATSHYFDRLVHGGLSEAQTRSAQLEDVDPDTFVRFLKYAYRGDYTNPSWTDDSIASDGHPTPNQDVDMNTTAEPSPPAPELHIPPTIGPPISPAGGWSNSRAAPSDFNAYAINYGAAPSSKKTTKFQKVQFSSRTLFDKRCYIKSDNLSISLSAECVPEQNMSPRHNFTPVFLAHARLYTFADMRMVQPLKDLVLSKLHKTLVHFELYPERVGDVVKLARYAYEHGEDRSENGRIDALRDMVVHYIACEMKVFGKDADFRNLIREGGEFAGDFWDIASQELL